MKLEIWTTKSANAKLTEIIKLEPKQRKSIADEIKKDLKQWAKKNFTLTKLQQECYDLLPQEYWDETGHLIARAIEKKYPITISVTDTPVQAKEAKRGDKAESGWSQKDGFYVKYSFEF